MRRRSSTTSRMRRSSTTSRMRRSSTTRSSTRCSRWSPTWPKCRSSSWSSLGRGRVGPRAARAAGALRRAARAAGALRGRTGGPALGGRALRAADEADQRLHLAAHGGVVGALDRAGIDDVEVHGALVDLDEFDRITRPRQQVRRTIAGQPGPDHAADHQHGRRDLDRRPGIATRPGDLDRGETGLVHFWEHDELRVRSA